MNMFEHDLHPHAAELRNADGSWKYSNALAEQTSPYLLQHAHNPVDWRAWGPQAFESARQQGKPIFLSIGYSTCYWCHVMERLVFENPHIAALMNKHFVNIKVDREERPDVDDIYMAAVQLMTGRGGWPMSVFLTPPGAEGAEDHGLKPFYAGTYYPASPQHGLPGFPQVVESLSLAWRERRGEVIEQANHVAEAVREHLGRPGVTGAVDVSLVQEVTDQLLHGYDREHGGFGQAPKFPQPANLLFLLKVHQNNPDQDLWSVLAHSLDRMARGGMFDQIGGGFHRYSTDAQWLVPHFEKMLYDNGQLLEVYCIAHRIQPVPQDPEAYALVARSIGDYVLREMTDATGTFWSAQDAEVEAREGGNYVWTMAQVTEALGDPQLSRLAEKMYGLDRGPNFRDPHDPGAQAVNVLFLPQPLHELAREQGLSLERLLEMKARIDRRLLEARCKRQQPATDDKVLTSWNGLMIAGLARVGGTLNEPHYTTAAVRAADYLLKNLRDETGGVYRSMRQGQRGIPGFLEDYALFIHGLIELHRVEGSRRWLEAAEQLQAVATARFSTPEQRGYFDTLENQADLLVRSRNSYDGAVMSGNSQMCHNLLDLHELTGNGQYLERVVRDLRSFAEPLRQRGQGLIHMHHALLRALETGAAGLSEPEQTRPGDPVVVRVEPKQVNLSENSATIDIELTIVTGHHLNAADTSVQGLVPTRLTLENAEGWGLQVRYPSGHSAQFSFADQMIEVYEGRVVLEATLTWGGVARPESPPHLFLNYQACTGRECLLPTTVALPVRIVNTK